MAGAIKSYTDAFSLYLKNFTDYIIYSILASFAGFILAIVAIVFIAMIGILSQGGPAKLLSGASSMGAIQLSILLLVVLAGFLIFAWLIAGLVGAYLYTINMFISGRKQTFAGFLGAIPKFATDIFIFKIIAGIAFIIPVAVVAVLASLLSMGSLMPIIVAIFTAIYSAIISLLLFFGIPAMVVHGKKPIDAIKTSMALSVKNIISIIGFLLLSMVMFIPFLIPLYLPLLFVPVFSAALLMLYKGAR